MGKSLQATCSLCEVFWGLWKGSQYVGMRPEDFCAALLGTVLIAMYIAVITIGNRGITRYGRQQVFRTSYRHRVRRLYSPSF